ncbi:MAG: hypothetical protein V5A20_11560 [Salinibacter sp.]|uniref:hypothetical protein n=1 Tax=Salinibacter sp. TaxID=2065818 RepID=UPI002FC2F33E
MPEYYQLHDFHVRTRSDSPTVSRLLRRTLQFKGAQYEGEEAPPTSDGVEVTLDISADRDPASPPEEARHIDVSGHAELDAWRTPGRMVLRYRDVTVDLHPDAGLAEAAVPSDLLTSRPDRRHSSLLSYMVALSLAILLRAHGWFPLHAAGLTREGRGVLLTARSGSGKTTTALSLVRKGWGYLSDDTVLLRSEDSRIRAYSFRRDFCVDPGLAAHFPELDGPEWPSAPNDASKWRVDPGRIYLGQPTATCTPALVVLPTLANASESSVEPVGTKAALEQLLNQGGFFLTPGSDTADDHLTVLRRLIDQARTYRLHAGRDVLEEPRTVQALLAPLLEDAPVPGA